MRLFSRPYLKGIIDSLNSITLPIQIITSSKSRHIFNYLIIYNLLICLPMNLILQIYPIYWNITGSRILMIYNFIILLFWLIPNYIIGIVYNSHYTNKSIELFINRHISPHTNLKYNCYNRYSNYIVNKSYYHIIVTFLTLETFLISYIPYIGPHMDWFVTSLIYSYYSWEYSWSHNKVPHINRYSIFERNWLYYLGYGSIFGFIKIYIGFLNSTYIIASIFPIFSMNTLLLYKPEPDINLPVTLKLPIFYLPIKYADTLINQITLYIKNRLV